MKFRNVLIFMKTLKTIRYFSQKPLKMNSNICYMRHLKGSEQFDISFLYKNNELNISKTFNFSPKLCQSLSVFTTRVKSSIYKALIKKKKTVNTNINIDVIIKVDGKHIHSETLCSEIFQDNQNIYLMLNDHQYNVVINSPWVNVITLPNLLLCGFPIYLKKIDLIHTSVKQSTFTWSKSKDKSKWTEIGTFTYYTPEVDDLDYYLKVSCLPKNDKVEGPAFEAVSINKVVDCSKYFPFQKRHQFTKLKLTDNMFRMVSYNILAEVYSDTTYSKTTLFPYCPPEFLIMEYRKQLLLKEIIGYNSDIICLQEIDKKIYKEFQRIFSDLDYDSDLFLKNKKTGEGVALFYNRNRFKQLSSHHVQFSQMNLNPQFSSIFEKIKKNNELFVKIISLNTVLMVNIMESLDNNEIIVVANTHLYYYPTADNIRLMQAGLFIMYLENLINNLKKEFKSKRISLVFCGDFNSTPDCGIYKLYTTGQITEDCIDFQSNKDEIIVDVNFKQNFQLESACGIPEFTNFTVGFAACIDYIFYEKSSLNVKQVVPFPTNDELKEHIALPNKIFPSDHIPLIADFQWK